MYSITSVHKNGPLTNELGGPLKPQSVNSLLRIYRTVLVEVPRIEMLMITSSVASHVHLLRLFSDNNSITRLLLVIAHA